MAEDNQKGAEQEADTTVLTEDDAGQEKQQDTQGKQEKQEDTSGKQEGSEDEAGKSEDAEKKGDEDETPAEYADFNLPEGMEMDEAALGDFLPLAREMKLSQESAQKFVDIFTKGAERTAKATEATWKELKEGWRKELRADKEVGGERYDQSIQHAKLAVQKLGTPGLREVLNVTGMGDHVEVVRFFSKVGALIGDDKVDLGNVAGGESKDPARTMFPSMK